MILEKDDDDDDGDDIAVPCRGLKLFSQHFQGKLALLRGDHGFCQLSLKGCKKYLFESSFLSFCWVNGHHEEGSYIIGNFAI